jgi:hypothetical protein
VYYLLFYISVLVILYALHSGPLRIVLAAGVVTAMWAVAIWLPKRYKFQYVSLQTLGISTALFLILVVILLLATA